MFSLNWRERLLSCYLTLYLAYAGNKNFFFNDSGYWLTPNHLAGADDAGSFWRLEVGGTKLLICWPLTTGHWQLDFNSQTFPSSTH